MQDKKVTAKDVVKAKIAFTLAPPHMQQMSQIRSSLLVLFAILWFRKQLFTNTKDLIVFLTIGILISWIIRILGNRSLNRRINAEMEAGLAAFASRQTLLDKPWPGQD